MQVGKGGLHSLHLEFFQWKLSADDFVRRAVLWVVFCELSRR